MSQLRQTANQTGDGIQHSLTPERLLDQSPELAPIINTLLYPARQQSAHSGQSDNWVALIFLSGLKTDAEKTDAREVLQASIAAIDGAELIDLKQASMSLVSDYRARVFGLLGAAMIAIALLLLIATRSPARVIWLLGTITGALATSLVVGSYLLDGLSLFDVVALALVAGLGLDYALFFSRAEQSVTAIESTARAVSLCALSSFLVFGILGFFQRTAAQELRAYRGQRRCSSLSARSIRPLAKRQLTATA